jgi:hypothetical protein
LDDMVDFIIDGQRYGIISWCNCKIKADGCRSVSSVDCRQDLAISFRHKEREPHVECKVTASYVRKGPILKNLPPSLFHLD